MRNATFLTVLTLLALVAGTGVLRAQSGTIPAYLPDEVKDKMEGFPVYEARNALELITILTETAGDDKVILLTDNVFFAPPQTFTLGGETVYLLLGVNNLQGPDALTFEGDGEVNLVGSATAFNKGLDVRDTVTLNYYGIYAADKVDVLGGTPGDNVTFALTAPNSGWSAYAEANYIDALPDPANLDQLPGGTTIVGHLGKATLTIGNGNWIKNAETIVGAEFGSEGIVNITNGARWQGLGSFYIGYEGKGTVNINNGASVLLGAIEIGRVATSEGELNVNGVGGTTLTLFGRDDIDPVRGRSSGSTGGFDGLGAPIFAVGGSKIPAGIPYSLGQGTMNVTNKAVVTFDYTARQIIDGSNSAFAPKIVLGTGESIVNNSQVLGRLEEKPEWGDNPGETFSKFFTDLGGKIIGPTTGNSLTFENQSIMEGSLAIQMAETIFTESVLSPGFGSYDDHEAFGLVEITGGFTHKEDAKTYMDFSVFGNLNYLPTDPYGTPYSILNEDGTDKYPNRYLDYTIDPIIGGDIITVDGRATLAGDIEFRPQFGYYSDVIDVHFLQQPVTDIAGQYDTAVLYPYRWFEWQDKTLPESQRATVTGGDVDGFLQTNGDGMHLVLNRNTTPFSDTANTINTRGVAGALDDIYNEQLDHPWLYVLEWMWLMNDNELREAMQQLSGETRAASFYMPLRTPWKFAFDRINWNKRQSIYFGQQNINKTRISTNNLWANVFYDRLAMNDDGNSNKTTTSRVSFVTGYDRALSSKSAIGVLFSYAQPRLEQGWAKVDADDWQFGVHYSTRVYDRYEVKLWAGYGTQQYRMQRHIPIHSPSNADVHGDVSGKYTGNTASWSAVVAAPYHWRNGVFRPFVAADVSYVQQNSTRETGFSAVALEYQDSDWTQFFGRVGLRADFGWERWNFTGTVAYSRLLAGHEAPHVKNDFIYVGENHQTFTVHGNNLGSDFFDVGLGGQICMDKANPNKNSASPSMERFKRNSMVFLQYNGSYGVRSNQQTASIGYQYVF